MTRLLVLVSLIAVAAGFAAVQADGPGTDGRDQQVVDAMPSGFAADICNWLWDRGIDPHHVYREVDSTLVGYGTATRYVGGVDFYHTTSNINDQGQVTTYINGQGQVTTNSYWVLWRSDSDVEVARKNKRQWLLKYSNTPHSRHGGVGYERLQDSELSGNHWAYRFAIAYTNSEQGQYLDEAGDPVQVSVPLYDIEARWVYSPAGWPWPGASMASIWGRTSECSGLITGW